jgi:hypothetical protein
MSCRKEKEIKEKDREWISGKKEKGRRKERRGERKVER